MILLFAANKRDNVDRMPKSRCVSMEPNFSPTARDFRLKNVTPFFFPAAIHWFDSNYPRHISPIIIITTHREMDQPQISVRGGYKDTRSIPCRAAVRQLGGDLHRTSGSYFSSSRWAAQLSSGHHRRGWRSMDPSNKNLLLFSFYCLH